MLSEFKFFIALTQGIRRKRNDLFAIFCVIIGSHALIDNNLSRKGRISLLKRDNQLVNVSGFAPGVFLIEKKYLPSLF